MSSTEYVWVQEEGDDTIKQYKLLRRGPTSVTVMYDYKKTVIQFSSKRKMYFTESAVYDLLRDELRSNLEKAKRNLEDAIKDMDAPKAQIISTRVDVCY